MMHADEGCDIFLNFSVYLFKVAWVHRPLKLKAVSQRLPPAKEVPAANRAEKLPSDNKAE
jgi:hypothetical protein